ncbi:MAG: chloride channel protein [Candidatus Gastranaerophilaceae bacterium]
MKNINLNFNNIFKGLFKSKIILQALLVGLISGGLVVLFKISISELFNFIQNFTSNFKFIFPFIMALGGLISGYLVYKFAPEAKGSGIPYVKASLLHLGNLTRVRSIFVKFFGGIASIGTGMSLGREGPSVQLGAGSGALIGKLFKMSGTDKDKLISAGAGSAIAATFNAPIAGTIFVLEELMQKFNSSILFPVLIATVVASSLSRTLLGNNTSFLIPTLVPNTSINIFICLIVGILSGIFGVIFSKLIHFNNDLFTKINIKPYFKPMLAGFFVGIIGLFLPLILGSGNNSVDILFQNRIPIIIVTLIFVMKFLVTPFCFGSGAVGGIFLPMLMLGAYLGYICGFISNSFGIEINLVAISLIGMASFLSAVARTPITATVMVFEMTGGYNFILPIMFACAVADLIAEKLHHKPIYSELIVNQVKNSSSAKLLEKTQVSEIMKTNVEIISQELKIKEALKEMNLESHSFCPVIDNNKHLIGAILKTDIEDVLINCENQNLKVKDIMETNVVTVEANLNLYTLYFRLHSNNCDKAVVIDENKNILGIISRYDIQEIL